MSSNNSRNVNAIGITKVVKKDTKSVTKASSVTFNGLINAADKGIRNPRPYDPASLKGLLQVNNKLLQCIQAMEVNIDGTGHTFVPVDSEIEMSEADEQTLQNFFSEPYPNIGFIEMRRKVRNDLESTGNAYLSVIRNGMDEVVALQHLPATHTSMGLTTPVVNLDFTLTRNGKEIDVTLPVREHTFVYMEVEGEKTHFMEFGAKQFIDSKTGKVAKSGEVLDSKGGEVIHLTLVEDPRSGYGVPRWINQLPSVVGSRKAEEQNLELLDNGGVPSAIIFLKGGAAVEQAEETLTGFLSGGFETNRAVSVSIQSTEGTIDKGGNVDVQVERFGSESVQDSMYRSYGAECKENIRLAFRLPPLFTGETSDFTFATAYISYMVAEAQVFKPERDVFDEIINTTVVRALGVTTAKFRSNPISLKNVEEQLKAVMSVKEVVDPQNLIDTVNSLVGTELKYVDGKEFSISASRSIGGINVGDLAASNDAGGGLAIAKSAVPDYNLLELALDYGRLKNLVDGELTLDAMEVHKKVDALTNNERALVSKIISIAAFQSTTVECC